MASTIVNPEDANSPRQRWSLIAVLDDGKSDKGALAIGRWDNKPVLAMRWNGDAENPIGNPQSRGLATWFILPEKYIEAILCHGGLTPDKVILARSFFPEKPVD
jgi:hypothetical protein